VHIAVFEKLATDFLARATFTEHIVRQHHGGFAIRLQHADDVLQEVELLIRRGFPEVLPLAACRT
jgi:hypothetical protein